MGKLEEALEDASEQGGTGSRGGLGGAVGAGGMSLQEGRAGTSAEDQIKGAGTLPDDTTPGGGGGEAATMPTSPEGADDLGASEQ